MKQKVTTMIIEDDPRASYALELTINQHPDFEVVAISETYADALLHYELFKPQMVFVDISLPDGSGMEVIQKLRRDGANCYFIMTTAERDAKTVEQAVQQGISDYLVKPLRMSRVHQALDDYNFYRRKLATREQVDQGAIDQILGKRSTTNVRQTPKGIDATTLKTLKKILKTEQLTDFSVEDMSDRMKISRITVRRYLEYLESEGIVKMVLNYKTGGRPRRHYQLTDINLLN
ncbi:response regulator [Shewanella sp. YIC-542]|uniref:response regulator n=1 Tax=Shewanella mytili TaxID=3377111 RepID=UPI00398EDC5C